MPTGKKVEDSQFGANKSHTSRYLFVGLIVLVALICGPIIYHAIVVNKVAVDAEVEGVAKFSEIWISFVCAVLLYIVKSAIIDLPRDFFTKRVKEQTDLAKRLKLVEKCCFVTVKLMCDAVKLAWGWYVLRDSGWLPAVLGGSGSVSDNFNRQMANAPYQAQPWDAKLYGLAMMGFNIEDLAFLLFIKKRDDDFEEYLLHHLATVSLSFGYIFGNFMGIGSIVNFLHDITSLKLNATRIFYTVDMTVATGVGIVATISSWIWTRNIVLTWLIVLIYRTYPTVNTVSQPLCMQLNIFLAVLAILHVYWIFNIFGLAFHFVNKNKGNKLN